MRGYCLAGFSLVGKYQTKAKMTECDKHIGLLLYRIEFVRKKFYSQASEFCTTNIFTIIIDWGTQ